jgi:hypothetical protein
MILTRRAFVSSCAALVCVRPALAALPIPTGGGLGFNVIRNDEVIGTHVLDFARDGDRLTVNIKVDLLVKLGPIPVFRYTHRGTERWVGEQVVSMEAKTDDDGDDLIFSAKRTDTDWIVEGTKTPQYSAPLNASPATHWNRRMLDGPLINTQTAKLMMPVVTERGVEPIETASGSVINAQRFSLSGDVQLDTWYQGPAHWAGISFKGKDGSEIKYQRLA